MILDYSSEELKKIVGDGVGRPQALRDYEVLKALQGGETIINIAAEHNISERQVNRIRDRYLKK